MALLALETQSVLAVQEEGSRAIIYHFPLFLAPVTYPPFFCHIV